MIDTFKQFLGKKGVSREKETGDTSYAALEERIGYTFRDTSYLTKALRHKSSVSAEKDPRGIESNERLEFLGDAVVNCLVTEELYHRFPDKPEGHLSKYKSLLVSRKILGVLAERINLSEFLLTGPGEKRGPQKQVNSIASNAFEALIGAAFLDSGSDFTAVRSILAQLLYPSINHFINDVENRNYKSRILELAQGDHLGSPRYITLSQKGPEHNKHFIVAVEVGGLRLGEGSGKNKKAAQQEAARVAIPKYTESFVAKAREHRSKKA
ncbi:ribonuclease III [Chitinivibrio alkaliphilus]|uniref:Ribonuclease 3 n=1 Tax=Chitinivibrio alkaliphilus ACht1 TaxID=1313304 RepID=U7DAV0_9BACT|nr:ribonuclease III [Chitinivibrio alkaliphilus]ERP38698.1 ribonuclease III [Chitinivibrio alkaliphilus ACht1]